MWKLNHKYLLVIAGPTGVGKTSAGIIIAKYFNAPIISADSRQFFKELEIGTAAPSQQQLNEVPHYFVLNKSIHEKFNASKYEVEVNQLLSKLFKNHSIVLLVGGSGLYIDAVCKGIDDLPSIDPDIRKQIQEKFNNEGIESLRRDLKIVDPETYNKIDLRNPKRIQKALEITLMTGKPYSSFLTFSKKRRNYKIIKIALDMERQDLYKIINNRVNRQIENGFVEEARQVYPFRELNALNTVGYKELFLYFEGKLSLDEAIISIQSNSRKYARKQLTWFRKDKTYTWFHPEDVQSIISFIKDQLNLMEE